MSRDRERIAGLAAALGAFCIWGLAPLYFKLLGQVGADEIIAHRVIWSMVFLALVLLLRDRDRFVSRIRIRPGVLAALLTCDGST